VKKLFLVLMASLALGATPLMADKVVDSFAKPGDFSAQAGLGLLFYGYGVGFSVSPGVEYGLAQVKLSEQFPINFGVAARGFYTSYEYSYFSSYTWGYTYFGLGGYGTAHYSLKNLHLGSDFFNHVDYYLGLGVGFTAATPTGTYAKYYKDQTGSDFTTGFAGGIGLVGYSGVSYYLNDHWAIFVEYTNFAYIGATQLGALYKF